MSDVLESTEMSLSGSLPSRGSRGMQQATGVMGWQWSHFLAYSPLLLESLLSSGLLSWQGIPRILPTHAYSPCAIAGPYREEDRRKDPLTQWAVRHFLLGRFCNPIIHFLILKRKKKKKNNSFVFPKKKLTVSSQKTSIVTSPVSSHCFRWWSHYSYD